MDMKTRQQNVLKELAILNGGFVGASASGSKNVAVLSFNEDDDDPNYDVAIKKIIKHFKPVGDLGKGSRFDDSGVFEGQPDEIADVFMKALAKGGKNVVAIATGGSAPHFDFGYGTVLVFTNTTAADVQKFIDNGYKA